MEQIKLQTIVGGALQEKFAKSFERVIENLQDSNTSFKSKREITIKLKFTQNENRDDVKVDVDVVEKLAPQAGMETSFSIGKDLRTGELYAEEYGKQIKGQMSINDYISTTEIEGNVVDTETGEIMESMDSNKIIDLRKAATL